MEQEESTGCLANLLCDDTLVWLPGLFAQYSFHVYTTGTKDSKYVC